LHGSAWLYTRTINISLIQQSFISIKSTLTKIFTLAITAFITYQTFNYFLEPNISLENCQPNKVYSKIQRSYDPLRFSVERHLELKDYFKLETHREAIILCEAVYRNDPAQLKICLIDADIQLSKIQTCYSFWTNQCVVNGGRCAP